MEGSMLEPVTVLALFGLQAILAKIAEPALEKLPEISRQVWRELTHSNIPDWKIQYLKKLVEQSRYFGGMGGNSGQQRPDLDFRHEPLQYHLPTAEAFLSPSLKRRTPDYDVVTSEPRMNDSGEEKAWAQALIQAINQWPDDSLYIPGVLIHGAPGVGKSTLLRVLVGTIARLWLYQAGLSHQIKQDLPTDLRELIEGLGEIPFPLLLDFASLDKPNLRQVIPDHLARIFEQEIDSPEFPDDLVDDLLGQELLICLDAVDQELDLTARGKKLDAVRSWSAGLRSRGDAAARQMLVISNRTAAELPRRGDFWKNGLDYWQIPPLNEETIPEFIGHWLNAYHKERGVEAGANQQQQIESLVEQLRGQSVVGHGMDGKGREPFPSSQLHLDLVCRLYMVDPESTNTATRAQVFGKLTELALESWEKKRIKDREESLLRYCGHLAVLATREGITGGADEEGRSIGGDQITRWTTEWLKKDESKQWKANDLIGLLANDLGFILRVRSSGKYRFTHQQFQEYLAAIHMLKTGDFNALVGASDRWLATASFIFELMWDSQAGGLLQALTQRDWRQSLQRIWLQEIERWGRPVLLIGLAGVFRGHLLDESLSPRDRAWAAIWLHRLRRAAKVAWSLDEVRELLETPGIDELSQAHILMLLPESPANEWPSIIGWLEGQLTDETQAYLNHCRALTLSMLGYGWATGKKMEAMAREERQRLDDYLYVQMTGGEFQLGHADESDNPLRTGISKPCRMRRFPVTRAEYARFMETAAFQQFLHNRGEKKNSDEWDQPRFWVDPDYIHPGAPVVGVSWFESRACAHAFLAEPDESLPPPAEQADSNCPWLPRETEWERAASWDEKRGQKREYPWGDWQNDSPQRHCNISDSQLHQTSPVVAFPAGVSPSGCYEMSGNVWEWQANWYGKDGGSKGLRGGAFVGNPRNARCAARDGLHPGFGHGNGGFRVARTDL